jgi:phage gp46-like protein
MIDQYDGEPHLFTGPDGGFLHFENGQPIQEQGLENAVFISLVTQDYWGNATTTDQNFRVDSRLFEIVTTNTISDALLLDVKEEVKHLLAWMIRLKIAKAISIDVIAESVNRIRLAITIEQPLVSAEIIYAILWDNQRLQLERVL